MMAPRGRNWNGAGLGLDIAGRLFTRGIEDWLSHGASEKMNC